MYEGIPLCLTSGSGRHSQTQLNGKWNWNPVIHTTTTSMLLALSQLKPVLTTLYSQNVTLTIISTLSPLHFLFFPFLPSPVPQPSHTCTLILVTSPSLLKCAPSPHAPGTPAKWPTRGLQLSCQLWATSWAWGIATERTSCLTQPMETVSMLISTACSIGYVVRAVGGPS